MGSSGAQCGIKGDVIGLAISGASLNVAPPLALSAGAAAPTTLAAGELIQRRIELALYFELLTRLRFLPTFPPASILIVERILFMRLSRCSVGTFLRRCVLIYFFRLLFFFMSLSSPMRCSDCSDASESARACSNRSSRLCRLTCAS